MVKLENKYISISFSRDNGAIASLFDKEREIEFIRNCKEASGPFRIEYETGFDSTFRHFSYKRDEQFLNGTGYLLEWEINSSIKLIGKIQIPDDTNEVYFYSEVLNDSEAIVKLVEYPVIGNINSITREGTDDYLAHSYATGFLIHNPMRNFCFQGAGLRYMLYPDGFDGATMQFFAYYGENAGGLYFSAYDSNAHIKWLNFYKNRNDLLEASFGHGYEDMGIKKGIKVNYPVVVKTLQNGDWYEAADLYKQWAYQQRWCGNGTLASRDEDHKSRWLLEDTGVCTFGINACHDRSMWIKEYHRLIDTKMFHILGPDWPKELQDYYCQFPGGLEDWFPARFDKNNIDLIKSCGDKYAPFEFDYLLSDSKSDGEKIKEAFQLVPASEAIPRLDQLVAVCPVSSYMREMHVKRDVYLQDKYDIDSIYYDISGSNIPKACMDTSHGHKLGAGSEVTLAFGDNYFRTKQAMKESADRYIPMGTEMINEIFIDTLDYYQARAGAQPAAPFEGWKLRALIKSGEAELIPLFDYVYHPYGPVRLDGWGKLVDEIGELFYTTAAKIYLWGGIYELNYEFSPMETINGVENSPDEHYYEFEPRGYKLSDGRGKYLEQFARLRTGVGNKYLSYGAMLKPLKIETESIAADWFHYNSHKVAGEYNDKGTITVPAVISSSWQYKNESLGIFFANVSDCSCTIKYKINMEHYKIEGGQFNVKLYAGGSMKTIDTLSRDEEKEFEIVVPARTVVMAEIV
jgi:hypothetical protein